MRIFILLFIFTFLFSSLMAAENSRIRNNAIVVKVSPQLLSQIDLNSIKNDARTGLAELDQLAEKYEVTKFKQRFPLAKLKDIYNRPMNLRGWFKVDFADSVNINQAVIDYKLISGVVKVEPIGVHAFSVIHPNDPRYTDNSMWYLNQANDADVDAPEAWDIARGNTSVIVADLDSGFRYYHEDLGGANGSNTNRADSRGNMWINENEMGANFNNGIDDDGNGKVDDWVGWDFVTGNPQNFNVGDDYDVEDNDPSDHNGHGTHTIGTIGAISNNNVGVASIAGGDGETNGEGNGVKVMGLRIGWNDILGLGFVGMEFAANALIYAADNGAKIASCSWGSSNSGGMEDAINYFLYGTTTPNPGDPQLRLIFKAAGNSNNEESDYMLDRSDVIGVASTAENDVKSDFSTYGTFVDISAPGSNILSTWHDPNAPNDDQYNAISGTSMATPCVASVAALVMSHNTALTAPQVEQILYDTADDIEGIAGNSSYVGKLGAGRVNAYNAIFQADQALPVQLSAFSAKGENEQVALTWKTESEVENLGFNLFRRSSVNGSAEKIADYDTAPELKGMGNSSTGKAYAFVDSDVMVGQTYYYFLEDVDANGNKTQHPQISVTVQSKIGDPNNGINGPATFALNANYPNPFNPTTSFTLDIPNLNSKTINVKVSVFNVLGKEIATLYNGSLEAGKSHSFTWDGSNSFGQSMPSGVYIYAIKSAQFSSANRMVLVK